MRRTLSDTAHHSSGILLHGRYQECKVHRRCLFDYVNDITLIVAV